MCLYWGSMWNAKHSRRLLFVTFHAFQFIVKNICFIWLSLSVLCDIEIFQALYYVVKMDWMWHVVIVPCIVCVFNCVCFSLYIPRMDGLSAVYTNTQHKTCTGITMYCATVIRLRYLKHAFHSHILAFYVAWGVRRSCLCVSVPGET